MANYGLPQIPEGFKPKKFWERPEGTVGMITLVGLGILGFLALDKILPFVIRVLENTLYTGLLIAAIAGLIAIVTSRKFQLLVSNVFKSIMRKITSIFVTIDPIGIMKNYLSDMRSSFEKMSEQIQRLNGEIRSLDRYIQSNIQERDENLKIAKIARDQGKSNTFTVAARKAGRRVESIQKLQDLSERMAKLLKILEKMREVSGTVIEDLADEIANREREWKALNAGYSAFKSATKILNQNGDQKELFNMAMEYTADQYGQKLGEIEEFMKMSNGVIEGVDLQNLLYQEDAFNMLEAWEKKSDSLLLTPQDKALLLEAPSNLNTLQFNKTTSKVGVGVEVGASSNKNKSFLDE